MLSIIIPTLNEENHLPFLLNSIKKQDFKDYEIIVADNNSKDKTAEIAKSFGCQVVPGGLPAKGRNEGAKIAKRDLLLFLDADLILSGDFLEKSLDEFKKRNLDIASYRLEPRTESIFIKKSFNLFYNWPITVAQKILAYGAGGILVKKEIFDRVNGFDEKIKLAEDHYFVRTGSKIGKFGVIDSSKIYLTLRRFETDGYFKTCLRYILCYLYMFSGKPVKSGILHYRFGHYSKNNQNEV